jgi:hypothetical protein
MPPRKAESQPSAIDEQSFFLSAGGQEHVARARTCVRSVAYGEYGAGPNIFGIEPREDVGVADHWASSIWGDTGDTIADANAKLL